MAVSFREFPWYVQVLIFAALAVLIITAGEYIPSLPVQAARTNLDRLNKEYTDLSQEVDRLEVYQRRYGELKGKMENLQEQLEILKKIVPDEKAVDEFIRMLQEAAAQSGVQIRRLTAQPVQAREYHYEMPFELQVDGPYYAILEFFGKLSGLPRIINVGDLSFGGIDATGGAKFPMRAGTTVTGTFTATTFFTKSTDAAQAQPPEKK